MSDLREQNLQTIQEVVNGIRTNMDNPQMHKVFFNPKSRNPYSKGPIEYNLDEKLGRLPNQAIDIHAMFDISRDGKSVRPIVNFDIDINRPLVDILRGNGFSQEAIRLLNEYSAQVSEQKEQYIKKVEDDPVAQQSYQDALNRAAANQNAITRNPVSGFRNEHGKDLMNFIVGHELAHLSFPDRGNIRWDLMSNVRIADSDKELVTSALYSINRGSNDYNTQHFDANYMSVRDEIRSDIAGMFMMAHMAMKENRYDEFQMMTIANNIKQSRINHNIGSDINHASSHNTEVVFGRENINSILRLAKDFQKNPNLDIHNEIMKMTEMNFINTLKQDGIVLKTNYLVNRDLQNALGTTDQYSVANIYARNVHNTNKKAEGLYDGCVATVQEGFKNSCKEYLNGNQLSAVDVNNDKIIDYNTVSQAMQSRAAQLNMDVESYVNKTITKEGKALERFIDENQIDVWATGHIGNAVIDVDEQQLKFKPR